MNVRRFAALLALTLVAAVAPSGIASSLPDSQPSGESRTVLVRFDRGVSGSERFAALSSVEARLGDPVGATGFVEVAIGDRSPEEAVAALAADPAVAVAEPVIQLRAFVTPNDQFFSPQQDYLKRVHLPRAWNIERGSGMQSVAIVDTGVDESHEDLVNRVIVADGHDFVQDDADASDGHGHGTMVAGVAAAEGNNATGVAGAVWNAQIVPVRVLNKQGRGTSSNVAAGITWAVDHGADVINLSLGAPQDANVLRAAVRYALINDVVVVAAAGNRGVAERTYPAAYGGVIAVTALNSEGKVARFSNRGKWVDVAAPGTRIASTFPGNQYAKQSGTSLASPIVAGIALLARDVFPAKTAAQITRRIEKRATDIGERGFDIFSGHGRVDAHATLSP